MRDDIFDRVKEFITSVRWEYPFELKRETELEEDLKITGDDAVEFIIAFGHFFDVDVSHFRADEYFKPEGRDIISSFLTKLFNKKRDNNLKILTIGDLENAVNAKKLV